MKKIAISFVAVILGFGLYAQEEEVKPVKNIFQGTRFINLQSANVVAKNELQLFIQHRFGDINGGFYELFGLDEASMRLGFEYGITRNFTIGIGRSSYLKTFDSFLKYRIFTQTASFPFTVTATASGSVPTICNYFPKEYNSFSELASGNVQFHVSKSFKSFGFQISPGFIGTGYILEENDSYSFFTLGFGGSVKLAKKVSANIEYLYRFEDEIDDKVKNPLSASVDIKTSGHLFQIVISNAQQMYDQAIITNPEGDWTTGNLYLGFNLIRGFQFNQY
jgi:hypothetical protein